MGLDESHLLIPHVPSSSEILLSNDFPGRLEMRSVKKLHEPRQI